MELNEKAFRLGTTGTRHPITKEQAIIAEYILKRIASLYPNPVLQHGDCTGSDQTVQAYATKHGYFTVSHPPKSHKHRAFTTSSCEYAPETFEQRNQNIVDLSQLLLAISNSYYGRSRSGTWMTISMALRRKCPTIIILPNGSVIRTTRDKEFMDGLLSFNSLLPYDPLFEYVEIVIDA